MAHTTVTPNPFPAQGRALLTITAEEISKYAETSALVSQPETQQKALRSELLATVCNCSLWTTCAWWTPQAA